MIGVEFVYFDREYLDQEDVDSGHLEFLGYFGRAEDVMVLENVKGFGELVRDWLGIDKDWELEGVDVECDYFLLTKERLVELIEKVSQASLKEIEARSFVIDNLNDMMNDFDWNNAHLAITLEDQ